LNILQIVSNRLQILYNLGDGNHVVSLDKVPASDGQWHEVRIKRRGKFLSLSMDNGEGIHYSDTYGPDYGHHLLQVRQNQIYAGAALNYDHTTIQIEKDLNSSKYLSYAENLLFTSIDPGNRLDFFIILGPSSVS